MSNPYQFRLTVYTKRDLTNAQVTVSENDAIEIREGMSDWKLDLPLNPSVVSLVAFTPILSKYIIWFLLIKKRSYKTYSYILPTKRILFY